MANQARQLVSLLATLVLVAGIGVTGASTASASPNGAMQPCGVIPLECHLGTPAKSDGVIRTVFVMPQSSIKTLNLRSARIVLAKTETSRPLGFIGDFINSFTGWFEPKRSETIIAKLNPSKRGNKDGDLVIASEWRPSSGGLDPNWTYAATLVTFIPGKGTSVVGSMSVDAYEELDELCAVALGTLLTTRDTAIGILDTLALTGSVFSITTGELPAPFKKSAKALEAAGEASFVIKVVSSRYNDDELEELVVEYAIGKSADAIASTPSERATLAAAEAKELAEFLLFQGETNGENVIDKCMY